MKIKENFNYKDEKKDYLDDDLNEKYMKNSLTDLIDKKVDDIDKNKKKIKDYISLSNNLYLKLKTNDLENSDIHFISGSFFLLLIHY